MQVAMNDEWSESQSLTMPKFHDFLPELDKTSFLTFADPPLPLPITDTEGLFGEGIYDDEDVPFVFTNPDSIYQDDGQAGQHLLLVDSPPSPRLWDPRFDSPSTSASSPTDSNLDTPPSVDKHPPPLLKDHRDFFAHPERYFGTSPELLERVLKEQGILKPSAASMSMLSFQAVEPEQHETIASDSLADELAGELLQLLDERHFSNHAVVETVSPSQLSDEWADSPAEHSVDVSDEESDEDAEFDAESVTLLEGQSESQSEDEDMSDVEETSSSLSPVTAISPKSPSSPALLSPRQDGRAIKAVPKRSPLILSNRNSPLPIPTRPVTRTSRGTVRPMTYEEQEMDVTEDEDEDADSYGSDDSDDEASTSVTTRKRKPYKECVSPASTKKRRSLSGDDRPRCQYCGTSKSRPHDVKRHEASCEQNPDYTKEAHKCWICLQTFSRRDAAYRHIGNKKKFPACNRGYIAERWMSKSKPRADTVMSVSEPLRRSSLSS